ncbi:hypothetical protein HK104_003559 [Borealophlyctis nickersoniae]|nr:hypothetical protein HK104_003559 [Borealophlyctis nickersoniae]
MNAAHTIAVVYVGTIVHSLSRSDLLLLDPGVLGISAAGKVGFLEAVNCGDAESETSREKVVASSVDALAGKYGFSADCVKRLGDGQMIVPGFDFIIKIDTHTHAPQFVYTGTGYDLPLLDWLAKYTFPRERQFADPSFAQKAYPLAVARSIRCGTTTAAYYGTIHLESTRILASIVAEKGQRGFIGKVCMDQNAPSDYIETTEESLEATKSFVQSMEDFDSNGRVKAIITPRFAPTCSSQLMHGLGTLAREKNLPIQTHLSENKGEIAWVRDLFPTCPTYTSVYASHGLLTDRTVLAHCVYLSDEERRDVKNACAGVSHCPNSNFGLQSGVLNVRRLFEEGVKVGLGTDVAGGYSSSIMDAMRQAVIASKVVYMNSRDGGGRVWEPLTLAEVFFLATLGGAQVLGLENTVGNFEPGKEFDALLVDLVHGREGKDGSCAIECFSHDSPLSQLEKFVYLGDDRNIMAVFVGGRRVFPAAAPN